MRSFRACRDINTGLCLHRLFLNTSASVGEMMAQMHTKSIRAEVGRRIDSQAFGSLLKACLNATLYSSSLQRNKS